MNEHFKLNTLEFLADFFLVPFFIMGMMHYNNSDFITVAMELVFGMFSWTLYEYLLHRFVLHGTGVFARQHHDHHQRPRELIANQPWMTAILTLLTCLVLSLTFGYNFASAYTSGVLWGYLLYSAVHVNMHHGDVSTFSGYFRTLYGHHIGHHRGGRVNYGVTVRLWDRLFRTLRL